MKRSYTHPHANAERVGTLAGCTYRQLDDWARRGLFGEHHQNVGRGSGGRRNWSDRDAEIAWALARSSELGMTVAKLDMPNIHEATAAAVRARPVSAAGEWLVVTADGVARRHDHVCLDELVDFDAARVIRLRSFTQPDVATSAPVEVSPASPAAGADIGTAGFLSEPAPT